MGMDFRRLGLRDDEHTDGGNTVTLMRLDPLRELDCLANQALVGVRTARTLPMEALGAANSSENTVRRHVHDCDANGSRRGHHQTCEPAYPPGLRRVPAARHTMGAVAAVPHLWTCRLLRFVTDAACAPPPLFSWPPDRAIPGARRNVAVVLRARELCLASPQTVPFPQPQRLRWRTRQFGGHRDPVNAPVGRGKSAAGGGRVRQRRAAVDRVQNFLVSLLALAAVEC